MPPFSQADIPDLSGQVIIVTGGNAGLGLETIRQLSTHHPARIYLAARSQDKAEKAIQELRQSNPDVQNVTFLKLDLASFESIKAAAAEFLSRETRLDILVNNAGIMMTAEGLSKEGYEIQFGTNVMGPALLTELLLPIIRKTAGSNSQARVVILSSAGHSMAPKDVYKLDELRTVMSNRHTTQRYSISKLADLHYAKALAKREKEVKIVPVHPGIVATNLHHAATGAILKPFLYVAGSILATSVDKGALSQIWAAVSPDAQSGQYYVPIAKTEPGSALSQRNDLQEQIFHWIQNELTRHVKTFA